MPEPEGEPEPEQHPKDGHPIIAFAGQAEFAAWVEAHHTDAPALWVRLGKKANPAPSLTYVEAMEVALCWGWVDGQAGRYDDLWHLQRFSPRKKRSIWSTINVAKVEALIAAGRMQPPGHAAIEVAKANGQWAAAYEGPAKMQVPADLQAWLDEHPDAAEFFAGLTSQNRYAILFRLQTAVRPATRASRFEKFTAMLLAGETVYR